MKNDIRAAASDKLTEVVAKAYQYFLKGLTAKEIGKLLDTSQRTVQRWIAQYKFAETATPTPIKQKAFDLHKQGMSYSKIAKAIRRSRTTVYYYITELRAKELQEKQKET